MWLDEFRSKRIRVFRNGDMYDAGKKLVVNMRVYRNFEQFLARLSDEINLVNGAARRVYTLDGHIVRTLDDLKDGAIYVATGGEPLKKIPYLVTADLPASAISAVTDSSVSKAPHVRASFDRKRPSGWGVNSIVGRFGTNRVPKDEEVRRKGDRERSIFGPTSKAYKVTVFVNGEATSPGTKVVLNYRNCRSFDQLLKNLTGVLNMGVRKLYDAETGHKVTNLRQVHDGQNLVAAVADGFKQVPYMIEHPAKGGRLEDDAPRVATFFPNGDTYHIGQTVTLTKKRFPSLPRLLDHLNHQIHLVTGMIHKIYDLEGHRIQSVEDIKPHGAYVVVSNNDPFIRTHYNVNAPVAIEHPVKGLAGQTQRNEHMKGIRKLKKKKSTLGEESTDGEQSDVEMRRRGPKGKQSREPSLPPVSDDESAESKVVKKVAKKPSAKHQTIMEKQESGVEVAKPRQQKQQPIVEKENGEAEIAKPRQQKPNAKHQAVVEEPEKQVENRHPEPKPVKQPKPMRKQQSLPEQRERSFEPEAEQKPQAPPKDSEKRVTSPHKYRRITKTNEIDITVDDTRTPAAADKEEEEGFFTKMVNKVKDAMEQENDDVEKETHGAKPDHEHEAVEEHIPDESATNANEMYGESSEMRVMKSFSNSKNNISKDGNNRTITPSKNIRKPSARTESRGGDDEYATARKSGLRNSNEAIDQNSAEEPTAKLNKLNDLGSRASLRLSQSGIQRNGENKNVSVTNSANKRRQAKPNSYPVISSMQTDFKSDDEDGPEDEIEKDDAEVRRLELGEGKKVGSIPALPNKVVA